MSGISPKKIAKFVKSVWMRVAVVACLYVKLISEIVAIYKVDAAVLR